MLNNKDTNIIINDVLNTIILVIENEESIQINMLEFISNNFELIITNNLIDCTLEDIQKIDFSIILYKLLSDNYKIDVLDNQNRFNISISKDFLNFKDYMYKDLIIYK